MAPEPVWFGMACMVWHGMVYGIVWYGMVWFGRAMVLWFWTEKEADQRNLLIGENTLID